MTVETLLLSNCQRFFQISENFEKMKNILDKNKRTSLSLRLIDFAVVTWSKEANVYFLRKRDGKIICIYRAYKDMLSHYAKKYLDPFKRHQKITLQYYDAPTQTIRPFETTVGQMCFFKWLIDEDILDFIEKNSAAVKEYTPTGKCDEGLPFLLTTAVQL